MSFYIVLSVVGIIVSLFLINQGITGQSLPAIFTLLVGIFFVIKEILDIFQGR